MNVLKPKKAFIQDELNIQRLTPIQWDGIIRAMDKYAKHYYETMQANEFEKPQEQCTLPVVINWVAIKDALPNEGDEVLTITEDGWYRVITFGSTGRLFPAQVTHWQTLPKPPCL